MDSSDSSLLCSPVSNVFELGPADQAPGRVEQIETEKWEWGVSLTATAARRCCVPFVPICHLPFARLHAPGESPSNLETPAVNRPCATAGAP